MNVIKYLLVGLMLSFSSFSFAAVDLNSATLAELDAIKNIGPVKAKAIMEYRDKNGGFKSVDELKNVKGLSGKVFDSIKGEFTVAKSAAEKQSAKSTMTGVININTADEKALATLPGVGEAKAKAIIDYRTKTPFKSVDDLANVKGFSKDSVNKIRANVSIGK